MSKAKSRISDVSLLKVNEDINETMTFTGLVPAWLLIDHAKVPQYAPNEDGAGGYQRTESQRRVDEIRDLILKEERSGKVNFDAFMSTVSINIRSEDARACLVRPVYKDEHFYDDSNVPDLMWTFKYNSKFKDDIYIVDGQHRLLGLKAAYELCRSRGDHRSENIRNFRVPALVTFTEDQSNEALQFYLINEKQKKVSTDGAQRLLVNGYKQGHQRFKEVIKDVAKVQCGVAVDRLAEESEIWSHHLRDFNETGKQKVSRSSFAEQSKRLHKILLKSREGDEETTNELFIKIIDAFYAGLLSLQGFDAITRPSTANEYALFKASQISLLQRVLTYFVQIWEKDLIKFGDMTSSSSWKKLLTPLENYADMSKGGGKHNHPSEKVIGAGCWRVGAAGSMGRYTSISAITSKATDIVRFIEQAHGIQRGPTI